MKASYCTEYWEACQITSWQPQRGRHVRAQGKGTPRQQKGCSAGMVTAGEEEIEAGIKCPAKVKHEVAR